MLGFTCQVVRVFFPSFAPCLEHVCGSVANVGLVSLYRKGL